MQIGLSVSSCTIVIARARQRYGASPLHLVGHLAALAIMAYAVSRVLDPRFSRGLNVLVWLVGIAMLMKFSLNPEEGVVTVYEARNCSWGGISIMNGSDVTLSNVVPFEN